MKNILKTISNNITTVFKGKAACSYEAISASCHRMDPLLLLISTLWLKNN